MKKLNKKYEINAPKEKVFEALTDPLTIEQWSGAEAVMNAECGGEFSLWGGSIHGKNNEVTNDYIIQDWKEKGWKNYSKVSFFLNVENGKTILELIHDDIPEGSYKSLDDGWDKYYLGAIKNLLEQ
ncbi:MAG: SRPBCC domain-containing protein [Cyclobacteriaceae bacterium]